MTTARMCDCGPSRTATLARIKDRPALRMIKAAERDGTLAPGATILEPPAATPASRGDGRQGQRDIA